MGWGFSKGARALLVGAVATGGTIVVTADASGAASVTKMITFHCADVYLLNADGSEGTRLGPPLVNYPLVLEQDFTLEGPTEVFAGESFTTVSPSSARDVPTTSNGQTINEVKKIKTGIQVTGAADIGNPQLSGGDVINDTATLNGNTINLTLPGNKTGSLHAGSGTEWFAPGVASFTAPKVETEVAAGAAGSQIQAKVVSFETNSVVAGGAIVAGVRNCTAQGDNVIATVNVVNPPPPGAPNAVSDIAETDHDEAVTIDVLANDEANENLAIDESSLAITADPSSGTAAINADGTITYTPNAGFTGTDEFEYELCSIPSEDPQNPSGCDTALVTVTVNPEVQATTTTVAPTTVAPTAPPATTAPTNTLPVTGDSSGPMALLGVALVSIGLMAVRRGRRTALR